MMWQTSHRTVTTLGVFMLACLVSLVAAAAVLTTAGENGTSSSAAADSFWESDIFHLPPEVAFPGIDWLNRIATDDIKYGEYSSVYAAILNGEPLSNPCRNFNAYINSLVLPNALALRVVDLVGLEWGHYLLCYMRNFFGGIIVYYGVAGIFHYFCYIHPISYETFEKRGRERPTWDTIWDQIKLAQASMTLYVMLPVVDEFFIEQGWTQVYHTVSDIGGWTNYFLSMILYFSLVEIGIYWMHRTLHTNKWMYKHIHLLHHKYKTAETLTPWASIAFHPIDGILQASPYVGATFIAPCHYLTHFFLLFFTAVWATYIHDAMDLNIQPIMGSKYHTVHHTHYMYNYGQVFVFCDKFWNTYREPDGPTGVPTTDKVRSRPTSGRGVNVTKKVE